MKRRVAPVTLALVVALSASACAPTRAGSKAQASGPRPAPSNAAHLSPTEPETTTDWQSLPDVDELRATFAARDDFEKACELKRPLREAFGALQAEDWGELLRLSTSHLNTCPVDIDFHFFRAIALDRKGRSAEAIHHVHWRRALVESVLKSGDGKTAETPWVVMSVAEEYSVMRAVGMRPKRQSLLLDAGIDAIVVEIEGEPDRTVYFNFRRMRTGRE